MSHRVAPAWFLARMQQYPDFVGVRFNDAISRWEFQFTSAAGMTVSQFFGQETNPLTGQRIEPDEYGLLPFRDLDDRACHEILTCCDATYLGNRVDGAGTWKRNSDHVREHNTGIRQRSAKQRAEDYAYALQQVDLRRPWLKDHGPRGHQTILLS